MSTSTTTAPRYEAWTKTRRRRLHWFAAAIFIAALTTGWAAGQVWAIITPTATTTPTCGTGQAQSSTLPTSSTRPANTTTVCATGWQLVSLSEQPPAGSVTGAVRMPTPAVPAFFGIPALTFLLVGTCGFLLAGIAARNAILTGLAIVPWFLTSGMRSMTHAAINWGLTDQQAHTGTGLNVTETLGPILFLTIVTVTIFIAKVNHDYRKYNPDIATTPVALDALGSVFRIANRREQTGPSQTTTETSINAGP